MIGTKIIRRPDRAPGLRTWRFTTKGTFPVAAGTDTWSPALSEQREAAGRQESSGVSAEGKWNPASISDFFPTPDCHMTG